MRANISGIFLALLIPLCHAASYSFDYSNCTFTYQPITANEFNFTQCTYSTCTAWFRGQSTGTCTKSKTQISSDWGSCTRTCCDPSVTYPQNMNSIKQCQDYLDSSKKNAIIVGSFVGSLFLIALALMIGCCICKCQKCRGCRDRCMKWCPICIKCIDCACCKRTPQNLDEKPNSKSMQAVAIENETDVRRPVWKGGLKQSIQKLEIPCSVCLHPKPSVQLSCGHFFHRNCIAQCLLKKKECSMCKSTKLMARVFCEDCFESFYEVSLIEHKIDTDTNRIVCTGCGSQFTIE